MVRTRPNILWICTDQQRLDTIHALGNKHIRTPNLDQLAREGVIFTNAYAQSPVCTPSRASFLTGCYPSTVHAHRNGNAHFSEEEKLLPRMLADADYECGLVGKLHLSAAHGRVEVRPNDGYRVFKWSHHPYPESFWPVEKHDYQQWLCDQGIDSNDIYGAITNADWNSQLFWPSGVEPQYHQTTWCANEAIAFICQRKRGPWLLSVNPFDPHPPFDPPPEYLRAMNMEKMPLPLFQTKEADIQFEFLQKVDHQTKEPLSPSEYDARHMIAAYYAQIELIDDQIGRILKTLEVTGQRQDTIIVFMSDHGEMLGDHGLVLKGCRFYEGAIRVPLIISWPGHFQQSVQSNALVELIDIVPTVFEALEFPIPKYVQGISFLSILTGQKDPQQHRPFVRCEYHDALDLPHHSHANMIFDGHYKLAMYHQREFGELYDLHKDPHEFHNLWFDADRKTLKYELMKRCFDATMMATHLGPPRVGPY